MVCVRFDANVVLVSGVCLLDMSEANAGLALSALILAGHHGNVFAGLQPWRVDSYLGWLAHLVCSHVIRDVGGARSSYVCSHGQQYRLLIVSIDLLVTLGCIRLAHVTNLDGMQRILLFNLI